MRRVEFRAGGAEAAAAPERFRFADTHEPVPGPGQLLVRPEAVGVSLALVRMLRGDVLPAAGPGGEMVGHVVAVGPDVAGFRVGDRVGGVVFEGVYAGAVLASPHFVAAVPEEVAAGDALALVRGGLVALCALRAGGFREGKSVLVTAAASGVGHLIVQLAKTFGADRVVGAVGSVGSVGKAEFIRACGADEVVLYEQQSWGDPVDVVLDGVGGELVQRGVDALGPHGRLVAFSAGGGSVDVGGLLGDLKSVHGFSIGLIHRQQPRLIGERRAELWHLLGAGRLRPACTVLPFDHIAEAVGLVESRRNLGRVAVGLG